MWDKIPQFQHHKIITDIILLVLFQDSFVTCVILYLLKILVSIVNSSRKKKDQIDRWFNAKYSI